MKYLLLIMMVLFCQLTIAKANDKSEVSKPDVYMAMPNAKYELCAGDFCGKENLNMKNESFKAIKLDASALTAIQGAISELSSSICNASDKVSKYTFTVGMALDIVLIGGSSGIAVEVQCK